MLDVARNAANEIVKLRLGDGWWSARAEHTITSDQLTFPTGLAELCGRLLITGAQLNAGSSPKLPFAILDLPLR